jgi:hypothetical protein
MKNVIGIDPGNSGALVLLGKEVFEFSLMPLKQDGKSSVVDYRGLEKSIAALASKVSGQVDMVFLERAYAGGMGATSAFNYGRGFATLELVVELLDLPVTYVEPAKWTKVMHQGISKDLKPKAKSVIAAKRLFPKEFRMVPVGPKSGKPHEGILDALLIAGYGMR